MSTIYDLATGETLTEGVQSQTMCDETIRTARNLAAERGRSVIVEDYDARECYRVTPAGHAWKAPASWARPDWGLTAYERAGGPQRHPDI